MELPLKLQQEFAAWCMENKNRLMFKETTEFAKNLKKGKAPLKQVAWLFTKLQNADLKKRKALTGKTFPDYVANAGTNMFLPPVLAGFIRNKQLPASLRSKLAARFPTEDDIEAKKKHIPTHVKAAVTEYLKEEREKAEERARARAEELEADEESTEEEDDDDSGDDDQDPDPDLFEIPRRRSPAADDDTPAAGDDTPAAAADDDTPAAGDDTPAADVTKSGIKRRVPQGGGGGDNSPQQKRVHFDD